jgi:hypothetical protein
MTEPVEPKPEFRFMRFSVSFSRSLYPGAAHGPVKRDARHNKSGRNTISSLASLTFAASSP